MYKSIPDGFKVINATEGFKGFTHVSTLLGLCTSALCLLSPLQTELTCDHLSDSRIDL